MPRRKLEEWANLLEQQNKMSPKKYQRQITDFVAHHPQLVLMAEKLIIEENLAEAGIMMLVTNGLI